MHFTNFVISFRIRSSQNVSIETLSTQDIQSIVSMSSSFEKRLIVLILRIQALNPIDQDRSDRTYAFSVEASDV